MPTQTLNPKRRTLGFAACFLASSFWGCGFYFGRIALDEMNVGAMVFYRFFFASLVLLPVLVTHKPSLSAKEWRTLLIASFLGVPLQFLLQFYGLSLTTVSHASLMVGTMPVILAIGAALFAHERMDKVGWLAIAASTSGAALIALGARHNAASPGHPTLTGDLLCVVSLIIALGWILLNKQLMERHSAIVVTAYGLFAGTLMLAVIVPLGWGFPPIHHISPKAWAASAAAGVLCTATTTFLWNYGLTQVPASQAGILLNMEPLIGSLLGVFALGEVLGPSAWTGGILILAAAVALTLHSKTTVGERSLEVALQANLE
jgi:drug/metabolite transporter (DMT)-like permease